MLPAGNSAMVRAVAADRPIRIDLSGSTQSGRAVVGMVITEFFTTISGLGAIIINSANNFDTATMFVPIVVLMVLAIGLNGLIGVVERHVAPWQAEIAGRD